VRIFMSGGYNRGLDLSYMYCLGSPLESVDLEVPGSSVQHERVGKGTQCI
jgi:hypothetical protein